MRVLVTGANGFLGWHTRLRLDATTTHEIVAVDRTRWAHLEDLAQDADAIIHIAGTNRGTEDEVRSGNIDLARGLAQSVSRRGHPVRMVYANSIQHGNSSAYGEGKRVARDLLQDAVSSVDGHLVDVRLPNLFGEHGLPRYNSFVATFVHAVLDGTPQQVNCHPVSLLHAQEAAGTLIDALTSEHQRVDPLGTETTVPEVLALLEEFHQRYSAGEIPDLGTSLRLDLFNTYRAASFERHASRPLAAHTDARGTFFETVRAHGGQGQTSFSTTVPGISRGDHYHLHKVERFVVLQGHATVSLRKMFTSEVFDIHMDGDHPAAVDMPTGWVHNITNTGDMTLLTQFWAHDLFKPAAPDTFPTPVRPQEHFA